MHPENFTRYALVHAHPIDLRIPFGVKHGTEQMFAGYDPNLPISGHNYNGRY